MICGTKKWTFWLTLFLVEPSQLFIGRRLSNYHGHIAPEHLTQNKFAPLLFYKRGVLGKTRVNWSPVSLGISSSGLLWVHPDSLLQEGVINSWARLSDVPGHRDVTAICFIYDSLLVFWKLFFKVSRGDKGLIFLQNKWNATRNIRTARREATSGGERGLQPGEHLFKARISIEGRG